MWATNNVLLSGTSSDPLLGFDRVWLVAVCREDKVLLANHMIQDLHADLTTSWLKVGHHMKESIAILYEECILRVGDLLVSVLKEVRMVALFVLAKKPSGVPSA